MASPLYRSRAIYRCAMRALYGQAFSERSAALAAEIPRGSSVVDLCAGDCALYLEHLSGRGITYSGYDNSPSLVRWATARGVNAGLLDVRFADLPSADVVVMQSSLYQFLPAAGEMVKRMQAAARDRVVLAEPIENLSRSRSGPVGAIARALTTPFGGELYTGDRFDESSLIDLLHGVGGVIKTTHIARGRELLAVLRGGGSVSR